MCIFTWGIQCHIYTHRLKKKQRQVEKKTSTVKAEDSTASPNEKAEAHTQNDHIKNADSANSDQEDEAHFIIGGR